MQKKVYGKWSLALNKEKDTYSSHLYRKTTARTYNPLKTFGEYVSRKRDHAKREWHQLRQTGFHCDPEYAANVKAVTLYYLKHRKGKKSQLLPLFPSALPTFSAAGLSHLVSALPTFSPAGLCSLTLLSHSTLLPLRQHKGLPCSHTFFSWQPCAALALSKLENLYPPGLKVNAIVSQKCLWP